ncbi:hypothetical protein OH76DRAFT_52605 [Lentinus brumalis]|uniref:Uncharacterized protein n=1 Tax=Lentinus brumalis TaxID=2498619 RepID=A0A371DYD1_9APHY|nr:hypothetical protein OH76DRAFT_52605 [Polyporus brumalis]
MPRDGRSSDHRPWEKRAVVAVEGRGAAPYALIFIVGMAGANYMGGKRNAARARGKDAASKAQRSHFGKKRFEVLRTGLSRSGGVARTSRPQNAGKERPEISLAHARWPQHGPEHGFEARELDHGLRSPFSPVARARSPSVPSSASNRSKILRTLDADSPGAGPTDSPDARFTWAVSSPDVSTSPFSLCRSYSQHSWSA